MTQNYMEAYFNGIICFQKGNYTYARKWFEISYNDPKFRDDSLFQIIEIYLKEGKYDKARKLLEENSDNQTIRIKQLYGLLENIEYNFNASKRYYGECMSDSKMQNKSLLSIAKLYMQTGDTEVARKMFETLQLNKHFKGQSTIDLVCLNILEREYKDAERLFKKINETELPQKLSYNYRFLNIYIKYLLGTLKASDNCFDPIREYTIYKLFDNSEEILLNHISKHLNQRDKESNGCFFKYIDLKKLLSDAREKIKNINASHFGTADLYRFRLDTPIGFKDDKITNDLCVVTMIGKKDILTMYPVLLSDEFDKEGFSTNKELILKRNCGGIKR